MSIQILADILQVSSKDLSILIDKYLGLANFKPAERHHIFVCGGKQHGKTTFANVIKDRKPSEVAIVSFADTLKRIAEMFDVKDDDSESKDTTVIPHLNMLKRRVYELLGTEIIRSLNEDCFIHIIEKIVFMLPQNIKYIVYPDMRFPNELKYAQSMAKHTRPYYVILNDKKHISECFYDRFHFDYELLNDGSLNSYIDKCNRLAENLFGGHNMMLLSHTIT